MMGVGPLSLLCALQISLWDHVEWLAEWGGAGSTCTHEAMRLDTLPLLAGLAEGPIIMSCVMRELDWHLHSCIVAAAECPGTLGRF